MGRPREHDDETREALRLAAETLFEERGAEGISVRALADAAGTTTRAVYSLFGSVEGLVVDALGQRAYEILSVGLEKHPETEDVAGDVADMAVTVFRRFVLEHPALFRIAFQRAVPRFSPGPELIAARVTARARLTAKIERLETAGLLRGKSVEQATLEFQALCDGLGNHEIRGTIAPLLPDGDTEPNWREAFRTLLAGFSARRPRPK